MGGPTGRVAATAKPDQIGYVAPEGCTAAVVRPWAFRTFCALWPHRAAGAVLPRKSTMRGPMSGVTWMEAIVDRALAGKLPHVWPGLDSAAMGRMVWCSLCGLQGHHRVTCCTDPCASVEELDALRAACHTAIPAPVPVADVLQCVEPPAEPDADDSGGDGAKPSTAAAASTTKGKAAGGPRLASRPRPQGRDGDASGRGVASRRRKGKTDDDGGSMLKSRPNKWGRMPGVSVPPWKNDASPGRVASGWDALGAQDGGRDRNRDRRWYRDDDDRDRDTGNAPWNRKGRRGYSERGVVRGTALTRSKTAEW